MERSVRAEVMRALPQIEQIKDAATRSVVYEIWCELLRESGWERIEDARFNSLCQDVSLVEHVRCVTDNAVALASVAEREMQLVIDYDELIASALLHDVSKLVELGPKADGSYGKTESGKKLQHGFLGACFARAHGLSSNIVSNILSHTGSSKLMPCTMEGIILFYADLVNADVHRFRAGKPLNIAHHK